jgi:hypothetical protein
MEELVTASAHAWLWAAAMPTGRRHVGGGPRAGTHYAPSAGAVRDQQADERRKFLVTYFSWEKGIARRRS